MTTPEIQLTQTQSTAPSAAPSVGESNPLVTAAESLLLLIPQIRRTREHPDPGRLRGQVIQEMRQFQERLQQIRYDRRLTTAAHYCLCVTLDEAVFKTSWGNHSVWAQQGLLSTLHRETWGGERFYIITRHAMENVSTHIQLLDLLYLCLCLGYEGKYYGKDKIIREEIRNKVFYYLHRFYGKQNRRLSPDWADQQSHVERANQRQALKKRLGFSSALLLGSLLMFNLLLYSQSRSVVQSLDQLTTVAPITLYQQLNDALTSGNNHDRD